VAPQLHLFTTDLPESRIAELERLLSPLELERAGRFHFDTDRARFVASRGTLRIILGETLGTTPESIAFAFGIHGKPVVSGRPDGIEFSLSRSQDRCAVVVSHGTPVGIDIEAVRPLDDAVEMAKNRFKPAEAAAIDSSEKFFALWTRKEAVAKALGWGLTLPFDVFEVDARAPTSERVTVDYGGESSEIMLSEAVLDISGFTGALAQPLSGVRASRL
jgi:4'-phosphopantetheinyl transferase